MSDPVIETAQQAITESGPATHAGWAILGGVVLKVIEAIAKLFGGPKERAEAEATEVAAHLRVAEVATEAMTEMREDTQQVRVERDDCKAELRAMRRDQADDRQRIADLEEETQACARNSEWMERALNAVVAGEPIPPKPDPTPRNPPPNVVRAAVELTRKET